MPKNSLNRGAVDKYPYMVNLGNYKKSGIRSCYADI
jgi:hypothetical protein